MNPTIDLLLQRKSVRAYTDDPVTPEEKDQIIAATLRAPTAGNMMLYSVIEVERQALKDQLAVTCDNQPFIAKAPYVLLFLADYQRWYDYYRCSGAEELGAARGIPARQPQEGDWLLACCDALIAAHTAVIASEAVGLGSCYIGDIIEHYETHRQMFNLPQYAVPIALVCFGHPTRGQLERTQPPRFDRRYVVHHDAYHHLDDSELAAMMQPTNELYAARLQAAGVENVGQLNYLRKFSAEFSCEMTRSVRAIIAAWTQGAARV